LTPVGPNKTRPGRHARRIARRPPVARADKSQTGAMRECLREHGYEVSDSGRTPAWLQQLYHDRH
ncbi:MAG TPA: hypothetical protein VKA58_12010, partial [Propionibacteriaceae bacterium]|nr:hypothetical protein [Propionibacteriaceae bacterium]